MCITGIRTEPLRYSRSMDECCESKTQELAALRGRQQRVLIAVLVVNAAMFCIEFGAGLVAGSTALLGDSLDMLGDSLVYAFTLYVLYRSLVWRARAALAKGVVLLAFGLGVLLEAGLRLHTGLPPAAPIMAGIGALALTANAACFLLLWRHRTDDLNLRSTWLCSRNDLIANGAVLAAAALVAGFQSPWPDFLVGVGTALLFLRTALTVVRASVAELASAHAAPPERAG
jgi:cation diffusion facilitator family transporter